MHKYIFENRNKMDTVKETSQAVDSIKEDIVNEADLSNNSERKDRKGGSYVWSYCDKLSRHTIRCKLCRKVMRFHGTANVITHLQRKHNIIGKGDTDDVFNVSKPDIEEISLIETYTDDDNIIKRRRRSSSTSIVWKYCTRISRDTVRCSFCKKNLSYQGTSNLQRHLHRMHGIVTQGRTIKSKELESLEDGQIDTSFVWEYCTLENDERIKCTMCNESFDSDDTGKIVKHLTITHAVTTNVRESSRIKNDHDSDTSSYDKDNWTKQEETVRTLEIDPCNIKKDDSVYEQLIEEDHENDHDINNFEEFAFDPNEQQGVPLANPLSPQTSRESSPSPERKSSLKPPASSSNLMKLTEERMRMETEYFREKAGFYRMQKYLTALQARKVRIELDRLTTLELGTAYITEEVAEIQNLNE